MVLFRVVDRSLGLLSTLILARVLVPADFGLVAMAMSVIAVIELATSFSFDIALIQRDKLERKHYDSAWTLGALIALGCGVAIAAAAYPAAAFYRDPRLAEVMLWLALGSALGGVGNIGVVDFRRSMDFGREFVLMASRRVIGFVVTVAAALLFRNYWALVIGTLAGRVGGVATSYVMHPYRPRFGLAAARELMGFSSWLLATNAVLTAVVRVPHFVIGRLQGPQALGLFTVAYDIATMPVTELAAPVNRAVFPGYSRLASVPHAFRETFLDVGSIVAAIALPAAMGIVVIAEPLVHVMLGQKWLEAAPLVQVLAVSAALIAIQTHNGLALVALGRPMPNMLAALARLMALVPLCFVLGAPFGALGVAWAELAASLVCMLGSYPVLLRSLELPVRSYLSRGWRQVGATILMGFVLWRAGFGEPTTSATEATLRIALALPAGILLYAAALYGLWRLSGSPRGAETLTLEWLNSLRVRVRAGVGR